MLRNRQEQFVKCSDEDAAKETTFVMGYSAMCQHKPVVADMLYPYNKQYGVFREFKEKLQI